MSMMLLSCLHVISTAQTPNTTDPIVEGGKVIVELFKVLGGKKETEKDPGCKGNYANLCIENRSTQSMTVYLDHRMTDEKREVVVLPEGKECFLQARIGVWTYDLQPTGTTQSIRKGDILIEGCNNILMNIK
jgi:hypothetical protein